MFRIHSSFRWPVALLLTAAIVVAAAPRADGYTPKDPKVQQLLNRAVNYLETTKPTASDLWSQTMGFRLMIAYAVYKHRKNRQHPLVVESIALAKKQMQGELSHKEIYELGVGLSFLTEFKDPDIQQLCAAMYTRMMEKQKPYGGWTYDDSGGDTSLIQYAMLGMWSAKQSNLNVNLSQEKVELATNWLLRTQDPAGTWAYRGNDPGNFTRVKQDRQPSLAMFAAGAGSLYISADLLGFRKDKRPSSNSPFTAVTQKRAAGGVIAKSVDPQRMWESLEMADRYWATNGRLDAGKWQYYYMYAQERYMSFRNEVLGLTEPKTGPDWYNAGVDYLAKTQRGDGSWKSQENNSGALIDTSLAALFLLRSTKDKIHPPTSGIALGGSGIPKNFQNARQTEDGKVVAPEEKNKIEDLAKMIEMLESDTSFTGDVPDIADSLIKKPIEKSQLEILKDKVANEPSYQKRLIAVRLLSGGGLDNAPVLIFALSDPDYRVSQSARDSLRLMSRKVKGFGLPDQASPDQKKLAQKRWSDWLRNVRPDLDF